MSPGPSPAVAVRQARQALVSGAPERTVLGQGTAGAVGAGAVLQLEAQVRAQLGGAGELQPLLADPAVTDVLVNGTAGVWVDRGQGLERTSLGFAGPAAVRALATRLAAACGQRLDDASPVADGTLPDGTRLHAVLPPLSAAGTLISLRTHRPRSFTLPELVARGTVHPALAPVLGALVAQRANVLISGATGSGKTTLLAALLSVVAPTERIVCIEESAELRPEHPHVVHLQVRRANVQQVGQVLLSDLVRAALRMRPDRLVLGECRGVEVRDVLGALNTGHDGGWATVHANTAQDVPARLVALGALAGMSEATVAAQAVSALDAVLHLHRGADGARRLVQVGVLRRDGPELSCPVALAVERTSGPRPGPAWPVLAARLGLPAELGVTSGSGLAAGPGPAPEPPDRTTTPEAARAAPAADLPTAAGGARRARHAAGPW